MRVVDDAIAAEEAVGDEGRLVVGRQYLGVEEADGLDRAISTLRRDEVAELEGLGDDDDDPTSEILQLAAESHTDSQTHRGQDSGEGYGLHAEHTSQEEEEGDVQDRGEDRVKERDGYSLDIAAEEDPVEDLLQAGDDDLTEPEEDEHEDDAQPEVDTSIEPLLEHAPAEPVLDVEVEGLRGSSDGFLELRASSRVSW